MTALEVTRLLANPLGQVAPAGQRGDMVRVSDGAVTIYLDPAEFDSESEDGLRAMLALAEPREGSSSDEAGNGVVDEPVAEVRPRRRRKPPEPVAQHDAAGSLTDPRRAGRRAQPLW